MAERPLILLTNDDGIRSRGLRAAVAACAPLGELLIVAPASQQTAAGRGKTPTSTGRVEPFEFEVDGQILAGYGIDATPAQAVEHALCEFAQRRVDFAVSGINYGENVGESVVTSGTVGAALEAASFGIPAIAASRQTPPEHYFNHDGDVDFSAAAFFLRRLVAAALREGLPPGVDLLKLDVPGDATEETLCRWTRVSRQRYFYPVPPKRNSLDHALPMGFETRVDPDTVEPDSDVYAVILDRVVSISPLSADMTARVTLNTLTTWCDFAESST